MDKRYLHHLWTRIRPIKTWYLLAAFVLCGAVCAFSLRHNYVRMTQLRSAVYSADQNNANVEQALQNLRAYVGAHMNTSLAGSDGVYPPIQLKYTYARLQQTEQDRVNTTNSQIYTDAQHTCEAEFPGSFSGGPRVPCIEQYVKDHGTTAKTIPDAMYKFDFASPSWSPDLAGISLVLSAVLLVLAAARLLLGTWLKRYSA
ncbi:MAG TPA: hypothetical protein VLF71_03115 [Candidatus Saccharimonadales bacterium]|nr:hypothetical protein [Candidatus Saccharimonadales bacterium]